MKRILGLDLGTNSIGWALINTDFDIKKGSIQGIGSRIIPMSMDILGNFEAGQSHSQTAERTGYRSIRRLYQRDNLRRERLHRVLNIMGFLPAHYAEAIDFEKRLGQFKKDIEPKLNYKKGSSKYEFLFMPSFQEMANEFRSNGYSGNIPYDWTIYYLRNKALNEKINKEELAWIILNFNQKRGYYQLRGEENEIDTAKTKTYEVLKVKELVDSSEKLRISGETLYEVFFENEWKYDKPITKKENWEGKTKEFIVTTSKTKSGDLKRSFKAVDSEKDWAAIKAKTEKEIDASGQYVGQFIYSSLLQNPTQKIRGKLVKTIERKYYRAELEAIITEQRKYHKELQDRDLYLRCISNLYPRNEAHRRNIQNKNDFFKYLFVEDIIFYQRPLKSKKSTIGKCQYEKRYYQDPDTGQKKEAPLKGIAKSHPLFQEFRLWQFLSYLSIYEKEKTVNGKISLDYNITSELLPDENAWVELFDFLNARKEINQFQLLKFFSDKLLIPKQKKENTDYRWNYPEDKTYPMNETKAQIVTGLRKIGVNEITVLSPEAELHLWHIIYSVKDKHEYEKALRKFAKRNDIDEDSFAEEFVKFPPFKSEYGAYSEKALKKLLPLMRRGKYWNKEGFHDETLQRIDKLLTGEFDETIKNRVREKAIHLTTLESFKGLPTWLAGYIVYDRHSEGSSISKWKSPDDIDEFLNGFEQHSLRNPIVEQLILETLRVVRDIWRKYGESAPDFFDEIHLELGREMKNPKNIREKISKRNQENENANQRINALLTELMNEGVPSVKSYSPSHSEILKIYEEGVYFNSPDEYKQIRLDEIEKIRKSSSPTKTDIQKYKLWLEQGYISPYTGEIISLSELFTTKYQIEHIIPQSRYYDNSMNNKVICESEINPYPYKDNQTAYEFISNMGGQVIPELSHQNKTVKLFTVHEYEAHCKRYFAKNKSKLSYLLSEEVPEGFISRQLNDSRYISKFVKGLLSNIVRENDELEPTSKNLVAVSGAITSKLKQDWGLNDKWNEIILPRFLRLNELTHSKDYSALNSNGVIIPRVPENIAKGFNKKRIDHRHHALDALVIAFCTKDHINYLNSLNTQRTNYALVSKLREQQKVIVKGNARNVAGSFKLPWKSFPTEVKENLLRTTISFRQNLRVINKSNNKTWQWRKENGQWKKKLVPQTKGDNWAIRKALHKETVSGRVEMKVPKGKVATAVRTALTQIKNQKHIDKIVDNQIREVILPNHLNNNLDNNGRPDFEAAFGPDGVEMLNKNIVKLNNGKPHPPIYKVQQYEVGVKFPVSENSQSPKNKKYVEAAKGTNLFFAVYWNDIKKKREYETIPLNVVVEHQKQVAHLPAMQRTLVPVNHSKGELLFTLSPNDLVFVPNDEELENPQLVDIKEFTKDQISRIYKAVSSSGNQSFFIRNDIASPILSKGEFSALNKMERDLEGNMIKERCWKLKMDRLGNVTRIVR